MTSLFKKPVANKRGRPVGSKNKPKILILSAQPKLSYGRKIDFPLGATSWEDAYNKTFKNLERAYERLVEFNDVHIKLEQSEANLTDANAKLEESVKDIAGLATIICYLELKLEERKED